MIGTTRDLARLDRDGLSAALEGWSKIVWVGTFAGRCDEGGAFSTEFRVRFRIACGFEEHGGPIADEELETFVKYVTSGASAPAGDVP